MSNKSQLYFVRGAVAGNLVVSQIINAAVATLDPGVTHGRVTYAAALCDVTLPNEIDAPIGTQILLSKENTSGFGITITADAGSTINGAASITPAFFVAPSSATTADQACLLERTGSTTWRMM